MASWFRTSFIWTWVLLRCCEYCCSCSQDECQDVLDEVVKSNQAQSMLQKRTQQRKVATTAPEAACPPSCVTPTCLTGSPFNGGSPLAFDKCYHHCSQPLAGVRYCGSGEEYTAGDTIDCSSCATGEYVHAVDGQSSCPSGYVSLTDFSTCIAGISIAGVEYPWSGVRYGCSYLWPRRGCFSWEGKLYFSTCADERPVSQHTHNGICKKEGEAGP
mmetsp:Transcript_71311/g.130159  ORF Transcript_71311/g.130159 Transcript_71311/m.130159 type:complete len:215 (-) Transcript_71311:46-690(-)